MDSQIIEIIRSAMFFGSVTTIVVTVVRAVRDVAVTLSTTSRFHGH